MARDKIYVILKLEGMITDLQKQFIYELTNEERSILLCCFLLKRPKTEVSKRLSIPIETVKEIMKYFKLKIKFLPTFDEILDSFYVK